MTSSEAQDRTASPIFEQRGLTPSHAAVRYALGLGFVVAATLAAKLLEHLLNLPDPALIFLTGVLCTALLCGLGPSIAAAIASLLIYDFFFVAPLHTLTVAHSQDFVSLIVFLVVAVLTSNLTTRLRNQATVLAEKAKTDAVMEAVEDGLILLDPAGTIVHANEVACAILDIERGSLLGHNFDALYTRQPHYLRLRAAVRDFLARPDRDADRVEITLFLRGRDHYFVMRPIPMPAPENAFGGLIIVLQDVTYLRDQEGRREALVATLSHELRTPLTSLSMAQELLSRYAPEMPAEQRELLEAAREDVLRLQDVAERLLDLSRSRAMSIAVERDTVDLHDVVSRVIRIFTPQAREKSVTLRAPAANPHVVITADHTKLMWAVSNLVSNALRYTPSGGSIDIEIGDEGEQARVIVSDTGPGIAPEHAGRVFERFAQLGASGEIGAAGLGLAIVRDVVQAHGGRIRLENKMPHGSRFVLELPRG